jgi:hypothetical protein
MKTTTIKSATSIFVLLLIAVWNFGCGSDEPSSPTEMEEIKASMTSDTWNVQSVDVDGIDETSVYSSLKLKFTETTFTSTNGGPIWPATGTWSFADKTGKLVKRGDGIEITIDEASTTLLRLKLNWTETTLGGGRTNSVSGQHIFTFIK